MAQRQFRSDDTSKWLDGFGKGTGGAITLSGTWGSGNGGWVSSATGTSGEYTLAVDAGWSGTYPCIVEQVIGTGAGNYELNYIISMSGGTAQLKYPLQNTYGSGAQCLLMKEYSTGSGSLVAPAWNGTVGGSIALMFRETLTVDGTVSAIAKGHLAGIGATTFMGSSSGGDGLAGRSGGGTDGGGTNGEHKKSSSSKRIVVGINISIGILAFLLALGWLKYKKH